ncbi:CDP-alcohol phosphatidyltransferase family protein [archaeon]|nr:CDP-alcohol phosphatidyltransferase family protein [archaeon]
MMEEKSRSKVKKIADRVGSKLGRIGFTPNSLTFLTLISGILAAYAIYTGHFLYGIILILLSGVFDFFDGSVARAMNRTTKIGAMLDSVVDKITELSIYFGIALYNPVLFFPASLAMVMFMLSSYISKHAGAIGAKSGGGFMQRKERILLLIIGMIFFDYMSYMLYVIAMFSIFTAIQRLWRTGKILRWK